MRPSLNQLRRGHLVTSAAGIDRQAAGLKTSCGRSEEDQELYFELES